MKVLLTLVLLTLAVTVAAADKPGFAIGPAGPGGARDLTLAPDLSFTDDSSANFPIRGKDLSDGRIATDRPTAIFFGTSHCWNTNREAERFVALYAKEKDAVRFVVVDLEHPSADQKLLVSKLYGGSIPTVAFLDRTGAVVYDRAGETSTKRGDSSRLEQLLNTARR
jgi:hypothetical protein